jgi:hypothetical protein
MVDAPTTPTVDSAHLEGTLTWVGGGFTLLAGIATFFGIKDGVLASVIRTEPYTTLAVFVLVGLAVILSLLSPALQGDHAVPPWMLIGAIGVVLVVTSIAAPDLPKQNPEWWTHPIFISVVVAGCFALAAFLAARAGGERRLGWPIVCLILAVFCLASGLWIVTKISVIQTMKLDTAAVTATLKVEDGQTSIQLAASGTELAGPVRVQVSGQVGGEETLISEMLLMPGKGGGLSATASVPVTNGPWDRVLVQTCQVFNRYVDLSGECKSWNIQSSFSMETGAARSAPSLVGSLTPTSDGTQIGIKIEGAGIHSGYFVDARVTRDSSLVASARVETGATGTVTWTGAATSGTQSASWELTARICQANKGGDITCDTQRVLAMLKHPAQ